MFSKQAYPLVLLLSSVIPVNGQFVDDVFDKYTTVGQLGMTVTNFGVLGNGWNKHPVTGYEYPSCLYKQHTEILREKVEHFSFAGLWVGGIVNGEERVSTAIIDGQLDPTGLVGFEFFPTSGINIKSSISSNLEDPMANYFDPSANSHQDFVTDFRDYGIATDDPNGVQSHIPLGIDIHLESYAWNISFADAFVLLNYTFTNSSTTDTIYNLYAGLWADASVANMNYTDYYEPGGGFTWYDNLDGFDRTLDEDSLARDIAYQYDANGDAGWTESYIGFAYIGSSVSRPYSQAHYNQWIWNSTTNQSYPDYNMPQDDEARYAKLKETVDIEDGTLDSDGNPITISPVDSSVTDEGFPGNPNSWMLLLSAGPLGSDTQNDSTNWILPPGSSCTVVFAVVAAQWAGGGQESPARRANLHVNKDWAQRAFDGEDKNRNNILDANEDKDGDGQITRYILPEPPPVPNMTIEVGDQKVTVYWSNNAEFSPDPISQEIDFEGYRIYGARKTIGEDIEFSLLGEFDKITFITDSTDTIPIGYNTGFDQVQIENNTGAPDSAAIDTNYYHYRFVNEGVQNGWLNYYAVTAYDRGDPEINMESLESSVYANRKYVFPGVAPEETGWTESPSVYPNPYRGQAKWDDYGSRGRMIWFQNLPPKAEIRIFTLAGDLVDIIQHDEDYAGGDIQNIDEGKAPIMSGGEHAWDLVTQHDQAIASGLYLFSVEDKNSKSSSYGTLKEGKFLIIK